MPYCILAIACAALGVGLLRLAWERRGERPWLSGAGWLVLCAAIPAWHGGGAAWDKAVALAALLPPLAALLLLAAQADWLSDRRIALRVRRPSRESGAGRESGPGPSGNPGWLRIALAGPVALLAALGLAVTLALHGPWSAADRLVAAGFLLPLAWAGGALGALMAGTRRLAAAGLAAHSALGVVLGALIYLVCLTGTLSVLVDELKLLEQPAPAPAALQPGELNTAVAATLARVPGTATLYALAPTTPRQRLAITAYTGDGDHGFIATGNTIVPQHTPFTDFVVDLHMTLTAPSPWGSLIVGLAGAALLALIISGVIAHPRIFRDAFRLRLNGTRLLREADLHNRLSVWGLPFHLAVTLTGTLFGLADLAILAVAGVGFHGDTGPVLAPLDGPVVVADSRAAPLPDLEQLVQRARALVPGSQLDYVGIQRPGTRGARIVVEVGTPARLPRGEDIYFDARGRQIGRVGYLDGSTGLQFYSGAAQVHFGFFGGLPVRLAYVALGGALSFITATGLAVWFERRERRGQPCPRLRRAWHAWTRGVPLALACAALLSHLLPVGWTFLGVLLTAQALALWRGPATAPVRPLAS